MPAPGVVSGNKLGGWRKGEPKRGGITPEPLPAGICRRVVPPGFDPPDVPRPGSVKGRLPEAMPDLPDMPADIGPMVNGVRLLLIDAYERGRYVSSPPRPMPEGIEVPKRPPNGATDPALPPPPMAEPGPLAIAPKPPRSPLASPIWALAGSGERQRMTKASKEPGGMTK